MEEIREVALAYYDNCTPELRGTTWEFFQSMDTNGDHRISLTEFNEFLRQTGYNTIITDPRRLFEQLDRNGDRGLDFEEVLTFYYIIKTGYSWCRGCSMYLSGLYFSCVDCFDQGANLSTFDLCDDCHGRRNFTHHHTQFLQNHKLLYYKRGPDSNLAVEGLYVEARSNYDASPEFQNLAQSFIRSMDRHGAVGANYQISFTMFDDFLKQKGYNWFISDPYLFQKLDRNRDGWLDFWEMLTFYYIIRTRYFHCRECSKYLSGLYFTCVACFEGGARYNHHHHHHYVPGTYNLCAACYRDRSSYVVNHHPDHTYFLDNHILLHSKRGHPPYAAPQLVSAPQPLVVYHNNYYINNNYHLPSPQPAVSPTQTWLSKLKVLELALIGANLAANCSIM